jgi:hypothetical protein
MGKILLIIVIIVLVVLLLVFSKKDNIIFPEDPKKKKLQELVDDLKIEVLARRREAKSGKLQALAELEIYEKELKDAEELLEKYK